MNPAKSRAISLNSNTKSEQAAGSGVSGDSPLLDHIRRQIRATGPLTVSEFMSLALYDPQFGYYRRTRAIGKDGDFVTAPEISQMFGELIGVWCYQCWLQLGSPSPFNLIELGPGRGTLMADILRTTRRWEEFSGAAQIQLVEVNAALKDQQETLLTGHKICWYEDVTMLPEGPFVLIANEFFDCLPVRQFVKSLSGWRERLVGMDQTDTLTFALSEPIPSAHELLPASAMHADDGAFFEVNPTATSLCTEIARRAGRDQGAALIIDYGYTENTGGETLQALKDHKYADPLTNPGSADLTAHVNFGALARAAALESTQVTGPVGQGQFLVTLGIDARAERLSAHATPEQAEAIRAALHRLTSNEQMGNLFKVLAITSRDFGPVAGFHS